MREMEYNCNGISLKTGRLDINEHRVSGHRGPVLDLKWNPFNDNVIASSSDDCSVMLWYIPDEGPSTRGITQPIMTLLEHKRRVSMIEWHPTAENILISTGADHMILVWNTSKGRVVRVINCHSDTIQSISLNRDGSLLATTCKDKILRIIDVRKQAVVKSGVCVTKVPNPPKFHFSVILAVFSPLDFQSSVTANGPSGLRVICLILFASKI